MSKSPMILCAVWIVASGIASAQASVRVELPNMHGSRPLPEQTGTAAVRDYLESWKSLGSALALNRADLLDPAFVGIARDKLTETIRQQTELGISTRYQDRAHVIQIIFYSPEGLSIELTDKVEYDVEILDHDQIKTTQHVSARYVIVLTPAEVRWRVRLFQAGLD